MIYDSINRFYEENITDFRTDFKIYRNRVRIIQLHGWVVCQCKDTSGGRSGRIRAADGISGSRGPGASQVESDE